MLLFLEGSCLKYYLILEYIIIVLVCLIYVLYFFRYSEWFRNEYGIKGGLMRFNFRIFI